MNERRSSSGHRPRLLAQHERDLYDWTSLCDFSSTFEYHPYLLSHISPPPSFDTDLRLRTSDMW